MNKNNDIDILDDSKKYCKKIDVPTEDELTALNAMRTIKDRVRDLKKRLSKITISGKGKDAEKLLELEKEIARLKEEWRKWEVKREEATRERMILLGHEER